MTGSRLLFNPGPTNVDESVRRASLVPDMNHRDAPFTDILADVCRSLLELAGDRGEHVCVPLVASGTGANEAALAPIHGPLLALVAGRYSDRMALIAERLGIPTRRLAFEPYDGVDPAVVERTLARNSDIRHLCFVHHETTTSLMAPLRELTQIARAHDVRVVVDAISSLFGHDLEIGRDGVDVCTVTPNKCLEALPGVSFVLARRSWVQEARSHSRSYYFDLYRQWDRIERERAPPFTHPAPVYAAIRKAIERLRVETVPGRARRYRRLKQRLRAGLVDMGLRPVDLPDDRQSNMLQLVHQPGGLDYARLHARMERSGITIYTDQETLGRGYLFFATMGALEESDVDRFLHVLAAALAEQGYGRTRASCLPRTLYSSIRASRPAHRAHRSTAVILAAGLGTRLRAAAAGRPKPLVPVAGHAILTHLLEALTWIGVPRAVIVTGYECGQVERFLRDWSWPRIETVFNPDYACSGTAFSLAHGLSLVGSSEDLLVLEGDVVLEPDLLLALLCTDATMATLLEPYREPQSGSLATVDGEGWLTDLLHETQQHDGREREAAYKTVNATWFRSDRVWDCLRPALDATLENDGVNAPLEYAMRRIVRERPRCMARVSTAAMRWMEVDSPEDLIRAEALFSEDREQKRG